MIDALVIILAVLAIMLCLFAIWACINLVREVNRTSKKG